MQRLKPACREVRIELQPWDGSLYQLDGDIPGVEPVQRLHLLPRHSRLLGNARLKVGDELGDRVEQGNHDDSKSKPRHYAEDAHPLCLLVRVAHRQHAYERQSRADESYRHEAAVAGLLGTCRIGLPLKAPDLGHERTVRPDVNAGAGRQLVELLPRQPGEFLPKLVAVARKRLIYVLGQKNVPLAWDLTSADAVNGIRVVYPALAATICLVGQSKRSAFHCITESL